MKIAPLYQSKEKKDNLNNGNDQHKIILKEVDALYGLFMINKPSSIEFFTTMGESSYRYALLYYSFY